MNPPEVEEEEVPEEIQKFYLKQLNKCWGSKKGEIIRAAKEGFLPARIMITTHPQRWNSRPIPWIKELVLQSLKNTIKRFFIVK